MIDLKNMTVDQIANFLVEVGEKSFRGKQIFQWISKGITSFDEMTNLSKELRDKLKEKATIGNISIKKKQVSKIDGTVKYLFDLGDDNYVESVLMKYKHGITICISSQAGCRMGCTFCASGLLGLNRNLTSSEMVDQIICAERDSGEKISNVVVMGTGEPFDNYENLSGFINIINDKNGLNLGMRSITVSTCGILPMIMEFGKDFPQVNLAISLHCTDNNTRSEIMPINKKYPVNELIKECRKYVKLTGRRITFEYTLVEGVTNKESDIINLANSLKGLICHVNLIPLNYVKESGLKGSTRQSAEKAKTILESKGISVSVRRELGADIAGACGQLRLAND